MSDAIGNQFIPLIFADGTLRPLSGTRAGLLGEPAILNVVSLFGTSPTTVLYTPVILINADNAVLPSNNSGIVTGAVQLLENGAGLFKRAKASTAVNMANVTALNAGQIVTKPGNWSITDDAAVNVTATITRAAVAGSRHICTSIHAKLAILIALNTIVKIYLRDGAAGVGPIIWSSNCINAQTSALMPTNVDNLNIVGSVNTAMTLEFSAAPGATNSANVSMTGFTVTA